MSSANAKLVMPASTAAASRVLMRFMLSPEFAKDQIIQPDTGRRALCGPHLRLGAAADGLSLDRTPDLHVDPLRQRVCHLGHDFRILASGPRGHVKRMIGVLEQLER